jgi:hypothetical protein
MFVRPTAKKKTLTKNKMKNLKNQIETLKAKEATSEKIANILSGLIIALLTIAGATYCLKGAIMQITANWNF